jgi:hypothetical protein
MGKEKDKEKRPKGQQQAPPLDQLGYRAYRLQVVLSSVNHLIRVGGVVACFYFMYRSVEVLAGRTTFAEIGMEFLANVTISKAVAWIFGAGGVVYGMRQGALKKSTVARLSSRIEELEQRIDPRRSSSMLTPRGETNPGDRV